MNTKNNCQPTPSSPVNYFPDTECPDCNQNTNGCNCLMSDIIYTSDPSQCMVSLGIARNMTLTQIINIYGAAICALQTNFTCADITMPNTYLNTGFVGTQYTATYTLSGLSFPNEFSVVIDGVPNDIGDIVNAFYFTLALNNLGMGVWTLVGSVLTAVGFHVYGNLSKDGSLYSIPTIANSTTYQSLCAYAEAVDTTFGNIDEEISVIDTTLKSLQTQITANNSIVLYANAEPVTLTGGATGNLHGFNLPANTLAKNGDTLLIDFSINVPSVAGGGNVIRLYLPFGSANYIEIDLASTNGAIGGFKLVRISDTSILFYGSNQLAMFNPGDKRGYIVPANGSSIHTPTSNGSPWTVLSLTTNSFQIQLEATTSNGATISSTFLTVAKLSA